MATTQGNIAPAALRLLARILKTAHLGEPDPLPPEFIERAVQGLLTGAINRETIPVPVHFRRDDRRCFCVNKVVVEGNARFDAWSREGVAALYDILTRLESRNEAS